jgi:membrane fusion protein (multidrug efflux system)
MKNFRLGLHGASPRSLGIIPALAAIGLTACGGGAPPAPVAAPPPAVDVSVAVERNLARNEEFVGELRGLKDVEIRARVQGYLEGIHFEPGAEVKAGQLLFSIDAKPFQAALAQANASLTQAQVEATRARNDATRYTELAEKGLVPRKQGDDARAQADASAANVAAARAVVKAKQVDLGYARVTSPINGRAGLVAPAVGDLVGQPSQPPLTTVSDLTAVRVRFQIAETDYLRLFKERAEQRAQQAAEAAQSAPPTPAPGAKPGAAVNAAVRLALADGSIYALPGRITTIDRSIDAKTGSLSVEAEFPNPQGMLRPGQFARVLGESSQVQNAILIPQKAVTTVQGVASVYVLAEGDVVQTRRVEGKEAGGGLWQVLSGLSAGERVVVEGQMKVREGVKVTAREVPLDAGQPALPAAAPVPAGSV